MAMDLLKSVSIGRFGGAKVARNASINVPKAVLKSALSGVPAATLRNTVSAGDAAKKHLELVFRVFEESDGQLKSISDEHDRIKASLSSAQSYKWDEVLDPLTPPEERNSNLTELLGQPNSVPAQHQEGLPRYASALLVSPSKGEDSFTDIRLDDPIYTTRPEGQPGTLIYRTFLQEDGSDVSPWHDLPLYNDDGTLTFFCEITQDTTAKFEVATAEYSNPVKQDVNKAHELRHYHSPMPWNYGMLPQTWEDPAASSSILPGIGGDNDPVDVVEIGGRPMPSGAVFHVKFLGAFAMIDGKELDWKIICINRDSPLAAKLDTITDVEREMPGELEKIMQWFKTYKLPDGKPENSFGFDEKPVDRELARQVISETHDAYKALKSGQRLNGAELSLR